MHFEGDEQNSSTVVTTELEPVQETKSVLEKSEKSAYELSTSNGQTLDDLMPSYYKRTEIDLEKINIAPSARKNPVVQVKSEDASKIIW